MFFSDNKKKKKNFSIWMVLLLLIISACVEKNNAQKETVKEKFNNLRAQIGKATENKNYSLLCELHEKSLQLNPSHPNEHYYLARAYALNNKKEQTFLHLEKVLKLGGKILTNLESDKNFSSIKGERFEQFLSKVKNSFHEKGNSELAYTIKDKKLIPEGVAYDPLEEKLYLSSIYKRKILCIDKEGKITDFKKSKEDELLGVIGMETDPLRRHLWVCSGYFKGNNFIDLKKNKDLRTKIFKYDLSTGKLLKKYFVENSEKGFFNDITISKNGDVFFTDTFRNCVYKISKTTDKVELFFKNEKMLFPNGITISPDGEKLFAANYTGVFVINTKTGEGELLKIDDKTTLVSIDGLAYYKNSLIAHQESVLGGVLRYKLNLQQDSVVSSEKLDMFNPLFNISTTGEILGNEYFYIANSQVRAFDKDGELFPQEKLNEVYILKLSLK